MKLDPSFVYSRANLYDHYTTKGQPEYCLMIALFHQCRLVLHASLVPKLSGVPAMNGIPVEVIRLSARLSLQSSRALSQLAADMLTLQWDAAQIAPFLGYCLYASACIHTACITSSNEQLAMSARSNLASSMALLETMRPYWAILDCLVSPVTMF